MASTVAAGIIVAVDIAITAYHSLVRMPVFLEQPTMHIQLCQIGVGKFRKCLGISHPFECCPGLNIYHWLNVDWPGTFDTNSKY